MRRCLRPLRLWTLLVFSALLVIPDSDAAETCRSADAGPIACGETAVGSISPAGDTDEYIYEVAAPGVIGIRITPPSTLPTMCYELLGPGGATLVPARCADGEHAVSAGTHTVRVLAQNATLTGSYALTVHGLSSGIACGPTIGCDQTRSEAIDCRGDADLMTFEAAAGERLSLRVAPATTQCYRLFGPDGSPLGDRQCGTAQFTTVAAGTHSLLVAPNALGTTGAYGITRHTITGGSTCAPAIGCGETTQSQIDQLGDVDAYSFEAASAGGATVRIGPAMISAPICFRLFGPEGNPLGPRACDFQDTQVLAGRHTLLLEPSSSTATGGYAFTIEGVSEDLSCGQAISCGAAFADQIERLGDQDAYTFGGVAGDQATIGIDGSLVLQMCFRLYGPDGVALSGRQCNTSLTWPLASTGVYTIVAEPKSISGTGPYTLDLSCDSCLDPDNDGHCFPDDNCHDVSNASQLDTDADGLGDVCDCDPNLAGASPPSEVVGLAIASDTALISWGSPGPGLHHDLARGRLDEMPVGSGDAEQCVAPGVPGATAIDAQTPAPGSGFWYVVRARNDCGLGTYGKTSSGLERMTSVCP